MPAGPTLVILGMMGRMPVAGVTWQVLHYLEGFRRLGFDPYYVEDTGEWSYDPDQNTISEDPTYAVNSIRAVMALHRFPDRWAYRAADGRIFGLRAPELDRLFERAEVLVNLTGATVLRDEHRRVPVRIYLETDPVLPQIEVATGNPFHVDLLSAHTHHFTYGENIGQPDCGVPVSRFPYRPTRPPMVLDWWSSAAVSPGPCFTTVAAGARPARTSSGEARRTRGASTTSSSRSSTCPAGRRSPWSWPSRCGAARETGRPRGCRGTRRTPRPSRA